jgi:hypothetical protein
VTVDAENLAASVDELATACAELAGRPPDEHHARLQRAANALTMAARALGLVVVSTSPLALGLPPGGTPTGRFPHG